MFFAFTAPLGIAAHLLSELAGLGWHDDADVIVSPRHGYLALIAVITLGGLLAAIAVLPRGQRRARIAEMIEALPFKGCGFGFSAVSFVTQFAFFALTQIGEGCPLCSGDIFTGVLAAAIAAAVGALFVALAMRRVLELAFALAQYLSATLLVATGAASCFHKRRIAAAPTRRRTPFAFRYRPPPLIAALA
ncbi:MAG TPA: hypothetical protein VGD50_03415 [Candidatus Baltobacteraceae bacterium]